MENDIAHQHPHLQHHHHHHQQQQQHQQREEPRRRRIRQRERKLSLENYLSFLQSRSDVLLTVGELNQIISMHGFKKMKGKKALVVEALSAIDHLADPSRSTLHDCISSQAFLTSDDVLRDLTDLNWQECSVTSMKTLNSVDYGLTSISATNYMLPLAANNGMQTAGSCGSGNALSGASTSYSSSENGGRVENPRKMKKKKPKDLCDVGDYW